MKRMPTTDWNKIFAAESSRQYWIDLQKFLTLERATHQIVPPENQVFAAFEITSLERTRVVILGQDPYHGPGQAHGLAFSVRPDVAIPPSLRNIFKELCTDLGCPPPKNGDLTAWAEQGVLLLNASLTVRLGEANSHQGHGWEILVDRIIAAINDRIEPVVFILWGAASRKKKTLIDLSRHVVIESAHPSPLSVRHGFFGSRPFSRANKALVENGQDPIDWCL